MNQQQKNLYFIFLDIHSASSRTSLLFHEYFHDEPPLTQIMPKTNVKRFVFYITYKFFQDFQDTYLHFKATTTTREETLQQQMSCFFYNTHKLKYFKYTNATRRRE